MGAIFLCFRSGGAGSEADQRGKRYMGGNGKVEGRACPAPTGCHKWVADERGKGGRQPTPFAVGGGCPGMDGDARPVGTLQASQARPAPLMGSLFPLRGFGGTPDSKVEEGAGALRTDSNTASV